MHSWFTPSQGTSFPGFFCQEKKQKCQRQTDVDTEEEREEACGRREEAAPPLQSSFRGRRGIVRSGKSDPLWTDEV